MALMSLIDCALSDFYGAKMTYEPHELRERIRLARSIVGAARELIMGFRGNIGRVTHKGVVDLVTEADKGAEALLIGAIEGAFPEDAILGEEEGRRGPEDASWVWYLDPLDGTTNFVHGLEYFAISVGISCGGVLVGGVVDAPALGWTCHGMVGEGAWCDDAPVRVSSNECLGDALLATGFPYDRRETHRELLEPFERGMRESRGLRRCGAAALDLVGVAQGRFDGFWEPRLQPWDMAAGVAIVRAAGGRVTAYEGREFDVFGDSVVASNGLLHDSLIEKVVHGQR